MTEPKNPVWTDRSQSRLVILKDMNDLLSENDTSAAMKILADELGVDQTQLTHDARLKEDLGADSLTLVEINMALEQRFHLTIPDERIEGVQTVGEVLELLADMLQGVKGR